MCAGYRVFGSVDMKQEKEPASEEILEVASGVLRLQLPVSVPGLGHVNCYALYDNEGVALVDPGLPGEMSWTVLCSRLAAADIPLKRVHTVIVTHSHLDHYGGCAQLLEETEAVLITHRTFSASQADSFFGVDLLGCVGGDVGGDLPGGGLPGGDVGGDLPGVDLLGYNDYDNFEVSASGGDVSQLRVTPWGPSHYLHPRDSVMLWIQAHEKESARRFPWRFRAAEPTVRVDDQTSLKLAGREWLVVHTPGHTVDHLCLWDPGAGILLAGDHVLPTITPHIAGPDGVVGSDHLASPDRVVADHVVSPGLSTDYDPLTSFLGSLLRVEAFEGVTICLPAHGHPFTELSERTQVIRQHHADSLDILRGTANDFADAPVEAFMKVLFESRKWGYLAASETLAHLEYLRCSGEMTVRKDRQGFLRYSFTVPNCSEPV